MPISQRKGKSSARCAEKVVGGFYEDPLEPARRFYKAVEKSRVGKHAAENDPFSRVQPHVANKDGARLEKNIEHFHAAGAVGRTRAAKQTAHHAFVYALWVFEHFLNQAVE